MHFVCILCSVFLLTLISAPAYAWGPTTHLELGLTILEHLELVAPAIGALIGRFQDDFLYGSIVPDLPVAKNLSPYYLHSHNWKVGLSVMKVAREDDRLCSFAWGYLAHLAADTVAHNYFVPYKMLANYTRVQLAHVWLELSFDARVARKACCIDRHLFTKSYAKHDECLQKVLTCPLFSFTTNKQIFTSMIHVLAKYTPGVRAKLTDYEIEDAWQLSLKRVLDVLKHGSRAHCLRADPTGLRNIIIARDLRTRLRTLRGQGYLLDSNKVGEFFRPLFRAGIEDKLVLASLREIVEENV